MSIAMRRGKANKGSYCLYPVNICNDKLNFHSQYIDHFHPEFQFRGNKRRVLVKKLHVLAVLCAGLFCFQSLWTQAQPAKMPIIPKIDAPMKTRLQTILAEGLKKGNHPNVFGKI